MQHEANGQYITFTMFTLNYIGYTNILCERPVGKPRLG